MPYASLSPRAIEAFQKETMTTRNGRVNCALFDAVATRDLDSPPEGDKLDL
jgi:hypothetical protein